mmetsp:Transcript_13636/g.43553  ORF Transcript_13636/g.43553 Transcript_13636/m.43553 type:complete len:250 (-) Transcript_13636:177-926(-)
MCVSVPSSSRTPYISSSTDAVARSVSGPASARWAPDPANDSPMRCRWLITAAASAKGTSTTSVSTVGSANPAPCSKPPTSGTCAKGDTWGAMPPRRSCSARTKELRSSLSVSPPSIAPRNTPSGLSAARTLANTDGRSFTQCSDRLLITRSNVSAGSSTASSSATRVSTRNFVPSGSAPAASTAAAAAASALLAISAEASSWRIEVMPPRPPRLRTKLPAPHPRSSAAGNLRLMSSSRSQSLSAISSRK